MIEVSWFLSAAAAAAAGNLIRPEEACPQSALEVASPRQESWLSFALCLSFDGPMDVN